MTPMEWVLVGVILGLFVALVFVVSDARNQREYMREQWRAQERTTQQWERYFYSMVQERNAYARQCGSDHLTHPVY